MNTLHYIPLEKNHAQKNFFFAVHVAPQRHGYWLAWIAALPGCAVVSGTKDDALAMVTHRARMYLRMLRDNGVQIPDTIETDNTVPVVAVTH